MIAGPEHKFSKLTFEMAILHSLAANVAVLDPNGEILAVNTSWERFAAANQMHDTTMGIGANYLDVYRTARADPNAHAALSGIIAVMKGHRASFYHEYPCHSPSEQRWFALRAAPLIDHPNLIAVSHEDISDRIARETAQPPKEE